MIEAGKLRHTITIKSLKPTRNSYGESTQEWVDFLTIRASKEPLIGNEYFNAAAVQSLVEIKFRARYRSGITNAMRIHHGTEVYEILSAINVQSLNRELLIYCKLVV
ncbi:phage head closure protein [Paenibacillus frigoriresistens]|uniref:phage head closure protein n=1 Tax=Paenibacillus alginolyticus TaxID=59839 RepID=UPI001566AE2E|nr:phage head closure protein [Paenibacillus frigoriresistens]